MGHLADHLPMQFLCLSKPGSGSLCQRCQIKCAAEAISKVRWGKLENNIILVHVTKTLLAIILILLKLYLLY